MKTDELLQILPARQGHFLLESGYHTDLWLTLDALFITPRSIAPLVAELASLLEPYKVTAICGPMLGGAFLAQALATALDIDFYYTEPVSNDSATKLFAAEYRLPQALHSRIHGARVSHAEPAAGARGRAAAGRVRKLV